MKEKASLKKLKKSGMALLKIKPVKKYGSKDLKQFGEIIREKISANEKQIFELRENLESSRNEDDMSGYSESDFIAEQITRYQDTNMKLSRALTRIAAGSYGICVISGKLIPKARLIRVPEAMTTMTVVKKEPKRELEFSDFRD